VGLHTPIRAGGEDAAPRRWKWTGDDLIRMGSLGVFPPEARIELMDGEIIEIMPPNPPHSALVGLIRAWLETVFSRPVFHARQENPIRLSAHFQPQPDIAIVRGREQDYPERFPLPVEVLLVVEVAETSIDYNRGQKLSAYAEAGIPEYWIVNLPDGQIEVYREPSGPEYLSRRIHKTHESVSPLAAPEASASVAALLGREP